jgi:hypothetical protein
MSGRYRFDQAVGSGSACGSSDQLTISRAYEWCYRCYRCCRFEHVCRTRAHVRACAGARARACRVIASRCGSSGSSGSSMIMTDLSINNHSGIGGRGVLPRCYRFSGSGSS